MRRRGPLDYRRQHSGAASTRAPNEPPPTHASVDTETGDETDEDLEERGRPPRPQRKGKCVAPAGNGKSKGMRARGGASDGSAKRENVSARDARLRNAKRMAASRACGASGAPRCLETRGGAGLTTRGMTT